MKDCSMVVKELSAVYDSSSMDTFVSVYYDGKDEKFIRRRERICRSILRGEELENFMKTMEKIRKFIEKNPSEIAIFASHKNNYFKAFPLSVDVGRDIKNALVVDSSPYVCPLAETVDEWESFTLILMNSNHVKIFSISCGKIIEEHKMSAEIMNKHKKGGWSQARFQRLRDGEIHAFFGEIAEALRDVAGGKIILAGPGHAKMEFKNLLPTVLQKKIIGVIDSDIGAERELLKESVNVINERERGKTSGYPAVEKGNFEGRIGSVRNNGHYDSGKERASRVVANREGVHTQRMDL